LPENATEAFKAPTDVIFYMLKGQTWYTGKLIADTYHCVAEHCVLMIEGENDKHVPLKDSMSMLGFLRYAYLVVFHKGSHMTVLEKPNAVNQLMNLFLNDSFR
jgi:hypothetical protein